MTEYICNMNRLDWDGNEGGCVRRGEQFNLNDADRAQTLLDAGYISEVLVETPEPVPVDGTPMPSASNDIIEMHAEDDTPDESWSKAEIKDRLNLMEIEHPDRATKTELLEIANPPE